MVPDRRKVVARQVRSRQELQRALQLVHENYVNCGYMSPHPSGFRLSAHYAMPSTRTFISIIDEEVIATVSLFCDSPLGLPMDAVYDELLQPLRRQGRRIGEVGMLADRRHSLGRAMQVLLQMMKQLFWTARDMELSDLLITVNPKHKDFYTRFLCFGEYGRQKNCQSVGGAPAVLLRLDLVALKAEDLRKEHIRRLFFSPLPEGAEFRGDYHMKAEDLEYFFLEKTDILRRADSATRDAIQSEYPGLKLQPPAKERVI